LHDKVHISNVQPSCCHVSCHESLELSFSESLQSDFSLGLGDVPMQDLDHVFHSFMKDDRVSVILGCAEHNCLSMEPSIALEHINESHDSILLWNVDTEMIHEGSCLIGKVLAKINLLIVLTKIISRYILHPCRDSR
jgi:hypothetical protein